MFITIPFINTSIIAENLEYFFLTNSSLYFSYCFFVLTEFLSKLLTKAYSSKLNISSLFPLGVLGVLVLLLISSPSVALLSLFVLFFFSFINLSNLIASTFL